MKKLRNTKGITLVALTITIIVMLILVGTSLTLALKGELFGHTAKAVEETKNEVNKEQNLDSGVILIDDDEYNSYDEYLTLKDINKWSGNIAEGFENGDGTEENPYQIATVEQLAYFAKDVNSGNTYKGEYIVLNQFTRNKMCRIIW